MQASKILSQRLRELENILGLSSLEMAKMGGCSRSTYYRYKKGDSVPDLIFLMNILKNETDINTEWLLKGQYPVLKKGESGAVARTDKQIRFQKIPFLTINPASSKKEGSVPVHEWEDPSKSWPLWSKFVHTVIKSEPDNLLAIKVNCDSMSPVIIPESVVLVNKTEQDTAEDGIFALRFDDKIRMKLVQRLPSKRLHLSTINKKYNPVEVRLDDDNFEIMGRIVWRGSPM